MNPKSVPEGTVKPSGRTNDYGDDSQTYIYTLIEIIQVGSFFFYDDGQEVYCY